MLPETSQSLTTAGTSSKQFWHLQSSDVQKCTGLALSRPVIKRNKLFAVRPFVPSRLDDDDDLKKSAQKGASTTDCAESRLVKRTEAVFGSGYFLRRVASEFPYVLIGAFNGVETAKSIVVVGISPGSVSLSGDRERQGQTARYRRGDNYDPRPR